LEPADLYLLVADTFERSAELAEAHVERDRRMGRSDPAEVANAERAREGARHARELASQLATRPSKLSSLEATTGIEPV
jgi:hypothetical protein